MEALRQLLQRLNGASLHLAEGLDFDGVLQVVADSARELTGARFGGITVLGASGDLEAFVTSGLSADELRGLYELPQGITFWKHLSGLSTPLRVADLGAYFASAGLPEFRPPVEMGPSLVAPILSRGEIVGSIYLSKQGPRVPFTGEDEQTLTMFATQAALAIANARRYRDEQRARADLEILIDTAPVGVIVLDADLDDLALANREALRITDGLRSGDDPPLKVPEDLVIRRADEREVSLAEHPLGQLLRAGETIRAERIVLARPGGPHIAVLVNATPIRGADGDVTSAVATVQDLTPLEELDRLRADVLGLAREEMSSLLVSVKGAAATLLASRGMLDPSESIQLAHVIDDQADRLRGLIGEMHDLARIHTGTLPLCTAPTDIARLTRDTAEDLLAGAEDPSIGVEAEPSLAPVSADQRQIERALRSILATSLRFSDNSTPVRVVAARDGSHARVSVTHHHGEPAAQLAGQLAGPLEGRSGGRPELSTLGLAIARGIIEAHGGRIWAGSRAAGETQISFTLPLAQPPEPAANGISEQPDRRSAATRILVVDVDPLTQRYINNSLTSAGYDFSFARDAQQARSASEAEKPDLVLTGFAHPDADGMELLRAMRIDADTPVIFVAEHGLDEPVLRLMQAGASDYIVKPFSPTELLARIRTALHRSTTYGQAAPQPFTLGDLTVDYAARTVTVAGRRAVLTDTEYRLLCELAASPGHALSSDQLMRRVWKKPLADSAGAVRSAVKRTRNKLGDDARRPGYIITVPRVGYRIGTPQELAQTK